MFAPYARVEVAVIALLSVVLTGGARAAPWYVAPAPLVLGAALLSFYRDPHRTSPRDPLLLLAAADGRITHIERLPAQGDQPATLRIVTFLSVLNVHVNRAPCAATVVSVTHTPGQFLNALRPESTERNERTTILLSPAAPLPGPIEVRQIAGVLARRIVCAVRPGQPLAAGQRIGMIKLGSRTEVRVPDDGRWSVAVAIGQAVQGGLTVLARRTATE